MSAMCYVYANPVLICSVKFPDVRRRILRECDIPSLFALYHDEVWHEEVVEELNERYKVLLGKFVEDAEGFRQMMRKTGCVISGSAALWFLLGGPEHWLPRGLHLMTRDYNFFQVIAELRQLDGARMDPISPWGSPIAAYNCDVTVRTPKCTFRVFQSHYSCALCPIPFYWSTHLMNVLTADALYCPYPSLTLRNIGVYPAHAKGSIGGPRHREGDRDLAFTFHHQPSDVRDGSKGCAGFVACSKRQRFFGDRGTFALPLGKGSVKDSVASLGIKGTAAWRLGGKGCGNVECLRWNAFDAGMLEFDHLEPFGE